jgi:hypothetical protein
MKLSKTHDQNIYFWGCTHIYHNPKWPSPLWKKRGYSSVEEYANSVRTKINTTCRPNDVLIHLGDGFLNSTPEAVETYLQSLVPKIYYIWGNHESSMYKLYLKYKKMQYPNIPDDVEIHPLTHNNITFLGYYKEIKINDINITLQHFPITVWNKCKKGHIHIHSHNHGGLKSSLPNANEGKILDVGVDVFPNSPPSFDAIIKIMNSKEIKKLDITH